MAFDTIDHTLVIDKLKYYGVHGINFKLFSSYLENRKQYTKIDNVKSNMSSIQGFMQDTIIASHMFWRTHGC